MTPEEIHLTEIAARLVQRMTNDPELVMKIFQEVWIPIYDWSGQDGGKARDYMTYQKLPGIGKTIEECIAEGNIDTVIAWIEAKRVGGFA